MNTFGKALFGAVILGCFAGAYWLFTRGESSEKTAQVGPEQPAAGSAGTITLGIAYGTEKRPWLEAASRAWRSTREGRDVSIELIPMGSVEGAKAILAGDQRIHLWAPASTLGEKSFVQDFELKYARKPFLHQENLALTPFVFVFWEERYLAFVQKYGEVTFASIKLALAEPTGWAAIAARPDWGLFKFAHTHPQESNSGLMTLWLMAQEMTGAQQPLSVADVMKPAFSGWLREFENSLAGMPNSTGNMMRDMVLKGPGSFDAVAVYENTAIDFIRSAEGRWGRIHVVYPRANAWNDNPCYVLDTPWSTPEHQRAGRRFLEFLMAEPMQRAALEHGFRPGNPAVPVIFPESPFNRFADSGLRLEIGTMLPLPNDDVMRNLLALWQRQVLTR